MAFMRGLYTLLTHTHMFVSAVGVQEAFVCLAHLVLQVVYGLHQLVRAHRLPLLMVPQVSFTKRTRAAQTRLHGLHLPADAGAAGHVSRFGEVSPVVVFLWGIGKLDVGPVDRGHRGETLELFGDLGQHAVDAELWLSGEGFLAHGAQELLAVIPVALQTGLTESVAAGSGDGLDEDLQTDGAGELLLRQDSPRRLRTCQWLRERDVKFCLTTHEGC